MDNSVTIVTLTRNRLELLKRAILSVQQQDYKGLIAHTIIVDGCTVTRTFLESARNLPGGLVWRWIPQDRVESFGSAHLAKLRNYGAKIATTKWIAFLDDDNEFEPNHISSLVACAIRSGCQAVHSYMQIFWPDGTPYLELKMPWKRDPEESKRVYAKLCARGVLRPGSNIMRDRADPLHQPDPIRTVDTGEWLLDRTLLLEYPFCQNYTEEDKNHMITEDDKLLMTLVENEVQISCSEMPTLKYYLGGYSNQLRK